MLQKSIIVTYTNTCLCEWTQFLSKLQFWANLPWWYRFALPTLWGANLKMHPMLYVQHQMENKIIEGREPVSSGYGWRLMFWRSWVRIPALYTGWKFFNIYLLPNLECLFEKTKKQKEAMDGPFFKKIKILIAELFPKMVLRYWSPDFTSAISRVTWRGWGWGGFRRVLQSRLDLLLFCHLVSP